VNSSQSTPGEFSIIMYNTSSDITLMLRATEFNSSKDALSVTLMFTEGMFNPGPKIPELKVKADSALSRCWSSYSDKEKVSDFSLRGICNRSTIFAGVWTTKKQVKGKPTGKIITQADYNLVVKMVEMFAKKIKLESMHSSN
jgi:hypothetical protein